MTLLQALRAALGASCGPLPPHRPITEADTLRREVAALQRACESHRRERQRLEAANAGLRGVLDRAIAERQRARRRLIMQTRANARTRARLDAMLSEAVHLGPDLTALHYAIRCRVHEGHARDARKALAGLPVHLRAAVGLRVAGWTVTETGHCSLDDHGVGLWGDIVRLYEPGSGAYFQHPWHTLPAPTEGEHPALAVIRRAVAGKVLP